MPQAVNIDEWQALEDTRQTGQIIHIVNDKGYGFVQAADGKKYFWHLTALMDKQFTELTAGEEISFILRDTGHPGGPVADRIYFNKINIINLKGDM